MHLLAQIAEEINKKANKYEIGNLQSIRKEIGGLSRLPSSRLFDQRTIFEEWGWHYGGRKELQFNIGIEGVDLRYGVAFSLECSQSLPSIDIIIPKIALFNEYLSDHGEHFSDLKMWHYQGDRSQDYMPSSIPLELVREGVFIFLGGKQNKNCVNYSLILETFDRLLPLYLFTETAGYEVFDKNHDNGFHFKAGCSIKASSTSSSLAEKELNILLRHNDIQYKLYKELSVIYGKENVGTEVKVNGLSIDLVVKEDDEYWFYEIKTSSTAKACIRQALGQIMEYSYWPGHQQAKKLVIVGEVMATEEETKYLEFLRNEFDIPIEYQAINA
ncbi:hypothetical protein [Oceanospirillum sediminis]|uniref:Uncharacterized protein n=1 Tax=Oceanospirillum sediminis TaxID=2760088 RepID=A0A839IQI1_9GAMM|nr:hypothetical protein [Oceanospirillum sediminis]MBB1486792.1 hypothetical protein [Oceanospirillum sediminis]